MKILTLLLLFIPVSLFSQFTWNTTEISVCKYNDHAKKFDFCENFNSKVLIRINEENTILKIISESYKRTFYIEDLQEDTESNTLIINLIEDNGDEYLSILDGPNGEFKIIHKEEDGTYMSVFRL